MTLAVNLTANLGPHADFIVAAYAVTVFVIALLIAWVVLDHASQKRSLGDLEERGVTRRSQRNGGGAKGSI
jgi:heme exporter protein D